MNTEQWDSEAAEEISFKDMDDAVRRVKEIRTAKDELKGQADKINAELTHAEEVLLDLMTRAGKQSYKLEGVAAISIVNKLSVTTPKTVNEKRAFFQWVENKYGKDAADGMMSVNSQTLNSFYNTEMEKELAIGNADFNIPGVPAPVSRTTLSVRKA